MISVHDDGPGIERADTESVFEPFWRGATGGGRSGLGLAIARGFALANGGTLQVGTSTAGATLELTFPAGRSQPVEPVEAPR